MLTQLEMEATVGRLYLTILDRDKQIAELQAQKLPGLLSMVPSRHETTTEFPIAVQKEG